MKYFIFTLSVLTLCANGLIAQSSTHTINGTEFEFVHHSQNDTVQSESIEIYRAGKKLISHILFHVDGDCSSENLELGDYDISGSEITFYTYWASADRMTTNMYPYGFRKQTYDVSEHGQLLLSTSEIYLEAYVGPGGKHPGMQYLSQVQLSNEAREIKQDYIRQVELAYDSHFVLNSAMAALEKSVRERLHLQISEHTHYWKEVYGEKCRM